MNSQIDEFERIMLDYLKGEISSEDMQKLTILGTVVKRIKLYNELIANAI